MPPPAAISVLNKLYPKADIESVSSGDLDGDGKDDIAYVIKFIQDDNIKIVIGILHGLNDNKFELWTHTKPYEMNQRPPEIKISKKILYVSSMYMSYNSGSWVDYKYSYRRGSFLLIGTDELYSSPRLDIDPGLVTSNTISTNFLTCLQIDVIIRDKTRTESKSTVNNCKLEELKYSADY